MIQLTNIFPKWLGSYLEVGPNGFLILFVVKEYIALWG